jgi:hypothetical protein
VEELRALVDVVVGVVVELLSVALSLFDSVEGPTSDVDAVGLSPVLLLPLVSRRSIILDTDAIPALTSLLTSEPRSATDELREKSLSFHSLVLFVIDSLYFVETAFKRDFKESEKDCISDDPALSGVDCPVECLLLKNLGLDTGVPFPEETTASCSAS